jgi:hypothetical protein
MNKIIGTTLAAATLGGALLAAAGPAAARDWGGGERTTWQRTAWHDGDRDHDRGWRGGGGWRYHSGWHGGDHDWDDGWRVWRGGFYYGYGPSCYTAWRWDPYWGRNVRVTYCD